MEYSHIRLVLNGVFTKAAPLSMRLYQIFNNDLLKELNEHVMTLKVYQHKIGSPLLMMLL